LPEITRANSNQHSRRHPLPKQVQLMPQYQNFDLKPPARLETVTEHAPEKEGNSEHPAIMF
jgi:hypothetical protein